MSLEHMKAEWIARFEAQLNRQFPPELARDVEELRRARLALLVALTLLTQAAFFAIVYVLLDMMTLAAEVMAVGVTLVMMPKVLRRSVNLGIAQVLVALAGVLVALTHDTGGLVAPAAWWMSIMPLMTAMLVGPRAATIALGATTAFYAATLFRTLFIGPYPIAPTGDARDVLTGLAMIGLTVVQYGLARSYEHTREEVLQAMDAASREIRRVFDNVDQGFMTVDPTGHMVGRHSTATSRWLGEPAENDTIFAWIGRADPGCAEWLEVAWPTLFEDVLPVEVALDQLPKRALVGSTTLGLTYRPIVGANGKVEVVILVTTDISARVKAERAQAQERDSFALVSQLLSDEQATIRFIHDTDDLMAGVSAGGPEMVRLLHTLKGNAGMFGMERLARLCHELESEALDSADNTELLGARRLRSEWFTLRDRIAPFIDGRANTRSVRHADIAALRDALVDAGVPDRLVAQVDAWTLEPIRPMFERLGVLAEQLGERLGKAPIQFEISDGGIRADGAMLAPVFRSLVHLVRNAVDHGVEPIEVRVEGGKTEHALLQLSAAPVKGGIEIRIRDDGAGVDWEGVRRVARSRGLPADTHEQLNDALFSDGLSTRSVASETSGRGVGLSAVRAACRALGGDIQIMRSIRAGTTFRVYLPTAVAFAPTEDLDHTGVEQAKQPA